MQLKNKAIVFLIIVVTVISAQSFTTNIQDDEDKPKNLKILPMDISEDELHHIMRDYSRALGVKCNYCHERKKSEPNADFASETKKEKQIAREMMLMVKDINEKYLAQSGLNKFEKITCVTCHMGHVKPIVDVELLPKKEKQKATKKDTKTTKDTLQNNIKP